MKSDKVLVVKLKESCEKSYSCLFDKYEKPLYHFAFGYVKSKIDAEGVVQDVFAKVWEKRKDLKPECSFKSYIFTIAFNLIKKVFIKKSRFRNYIVSKEIATNYDTSTLNQIDCNSFMESLYVLISKMPERRRETFIKSRFEGLSVKEIAKEMDVSPKTVENQITSSLKFLKANVNSKKVIENYYS